jgi:hypothetical protein
MREALAAKQKRDAANAYVKTAARYRAKVSSGYDRRYARQLGIAGSRDAS